MREKPPYYDNMIHFMADPTDHRTIKQFAADNNIHPDTYYLYRRTHSTELEQAVQSIRPHYTEVIRQRALKAVYANIDKSHLDRKLALQYCGDLIERTEVQQTLSIEEKRAKAKALMALLSDKLVPPPSDKPIDKPIDNNSHNVSGDVI